MSREQDYTCDLSLYCCLDESDDRRCRRTMERTIGYKTAYYSNKEIYVNDDEKYHYRNSAILSLVFRTFIDIMVSTYLSVPL